MIECPDRDRSGPGLGALQSLSQILDEVTSAFHVAGAAGLLLIDGSALREVEQSHGVEAHWQVTSRLVDRIRESLGETLRPNDRVVLGELGRDEVLVLLFRAHHRDRFYRDELPAIANALAKSLAVAGKGLGYPYVRRGMRFPVGRALVLRDPSRRPEWILLRGRDHAADDARLVTLLEGRRLRDRFIMVVLSESVHSKLEAIVDLSTGQIHAVEALVRGLPGSTLATPAELFEAAEELGMLFDFDCLCRRAAFRAARERPEGTLLFVNCLPSAIHDPSLSGAALRKTLQSHDLSPSDVVFEISERESIQNFTIFREACDHYRSLGFQIAIDDVSAGYSGLEVVTELSPDFIKVDRALVRGIESDPARREVLRALTSLAGRIGAQVIAEGIETHGELEAVKELSVEYGQGFLFGHEGVGAEKDEG